MGSLLNAALLFVVTALCSLRVYKALGRPLLTGMDERKYYTGVRTNLAHGFGYVYTPNFRTCGGKSVGPFVGGAALVVLHSQRTEPFILICSAACTALAIFWGLGGAAPSLR